MITQTPSTPIRIWLVSVSFVLFQFFLQLSSGIVISAIMHNMALTALASGALSATFYIIYTSMQIPVGMLFDRKNARFLLVASSVICSLGCFAFASSYTLFELFLWRTTIGFGSSFAFVGLSHLLRQHFSPRRFPFMIGVSETIGFLATVLGIIGLGTMIGHYGWRGFINGAGVVGLLISFSAWRYIPAQKPINTSQENYGHYLLAILTSKKLWANGLFIGLTFMIVTVFGAMWASSFFQVKLGCGPGRASIINALFFLGAAFSCPLFGWLSTYLERRKPLMFTSSILTTALFLAILYWPTQNQIILGCLMLLMGLFCGAYIIAFPIANELAPPGSASTCTGFTNTLALILTPILQPFIGYLLDFFSQTDGVYTLQNYQNALLVIPMSLLIACFLIYYLPEKQPSE